MKRKPNRQRPKRADRLKDKGFPSANDVEKAQKLAAKVGLLDMMEAKSNA